jgi:hypothetical protein
VLHLLDKTMDSNRENLPIKGIRSSFSRDSSPLNELKEAKDSLAYWWYKTLKESPAYKDICRAPRKNELWETYLAFGDIFEKYPKFEDWWVKQGRNKFQLKKAPPKVRKLEDYASARRSLEKDDVLFLEIPLTITKQSAMRGIRKLLNAAHSNLYGDKPIDIFKVADTTLKYQKSKIRKETIETLLDVYRFKKRKPDAKLREVADAIKFVPDLFLRTSEDLEHITPADELKIEARRKTIAASRYVKQAENLIHNAERGIFPSIKKTEQPLLK